MRIHILGICGTFMGGVAKLASELGHQVTGTDTDVYPPMSDQLAALDIEVFEGFHARNLSRAQPDLVVIGNALSRGNDEVEAVLDESLAYVSGPQWLAENVLARHHTLAVAGTHGKTTSAAMLAWILEANGRKPGFLIGGVPKNFSTSARLGDGDHFVVEADEYDTAFFDKRSKFVHYRPDTLILNNLEYDHADIFDSLADIKRQFHHLVRTVPSRGHILTRAADQQLEEVIAMGCWTPVEEFGSANDSNPAPQWCAETDAEPNFDILYEGTVVGRVRWVVPGRHNRLNALGAIAAAYHAGIAPQDAAASLSEFESVKRRLENIGTVGGVHVYDDFAHHPTAIEETLNALRESAPRARLVAVLEPRSNTMRMGVHRDRLTDALRGADRAFVYQPRNLSWQFSVAPGAAVTVARTTDEIVAALQVELKPNDHVVIMSNGSFDGLHKRLLETLRRRAVGANVNSG